MRTNLLILCFLLAYSGPASTADLYDAPGNQLYIPLVKVGNTLYTGVVVALDLRTVVAGSPPPANSYDIYDPVTKQLYVAEVFVGPPLNRTFYNVSVQIDSSVKPFISGSAPALESNPKLILKSLPPDAFVGEKYEFNVVESIFPTSLYTYTVDSLANGSVPTGMTLDLNGTLSGTPFATGSADVQGHQIPKDYSFGVCATDSITRLTSNPCPQFTVTVKPAKVSLTTSVVGDGSITRSEAGPLYASGTKVTLTAVPASGATFSGWSGDCSGTGTCALTLYANGQATATFAKPTCSNGGTDYPTCTPVVTAVTPFTISAGKAGTCSGGSVTGTFTVKAAAGLTWTATKEDFIPAGGEQVVISGGSGNGSGTFTVSIEVPAQKPSSSFSSCNLTYNLNTFNIFVKFSDGKTIGVTLYWTFVGVT